MRQSTAFFTAIAVTVLSVHASPTTLDMRAPDSQISPFLQCLKQKVPTLKQGGKPTTQHVRDCLAETNPKGKRDDTSSIRGNYPVNEEELVYNPESDNPIQARGLVDTITTGIGLVGLRKTATCDPKNGVHNEFVWANDIITKAQDVCRELSSQIETTGLAQDGGVGYLLEHLTNGHNKRGHQLQDKRKLIASYTLHFVPTAKMATDDIKQLASGIKEICDEGITRIMTKDEGCAQDIKYYRPSKAKHYTEAAAVDGAIDIFFKNYENIVATLQVNFDQDA